MLRHQNIAHITFLFDGIWIGILSCFPWALAIFLPNSFPWKHVHSQIMQWNVLLPKIEYHGSCYVHCDGGCLTCRYFFGYLPTTSRNDCFLSSLMVSTLLQKFIGILLISWAGRDTKCPLRDPVIGPHLWLNSRNWLVRLSNSFFALLFTKT